MKSSPPILCFTPPSSLRWTHDRTPTRHGGNPGHSDARVEAVGVEVEVEVEVGAEFGAEFGVEVGADVDADARAGQLPGSVRGRGHAECRSPPERRSRDREVGCRRPHRPAQPPGPNTASTRGRVGARRGADNPARLGRRSQCARPSWIERAPPRRTPETLPGRGPTARLRGPGRGLHPGRLDCASRRCPGRRCPLDPNPCRPGRRHRGRNHRFSGETRHHAALRRPAIRGRSRRPATPRCRRLRGRCRQPGLVPSPRDRSRGFNRPGKSAPPGRRRSRGPGFQRNDAPGRGRREWTDRDGELSPRPRGRHRQRRRRRANATFPSDPPSVPFDRPSTLGPGCRFQSPPLGRLDAALHGGFAGKFRKRATPAPSRRRSEPDFGRWLDTPPARRTPRPRGSRGRAAQRRRGCHRHQPR